jgi:small subunit ribosomal protein S1
LSFSSDDFAKALEQEQYNYQTQRGQVVRGKPFSYEGDGVLVDIGGKAAAFLPRDEASLYSFADISEAVPLDEEREFLVIRDQDAEGQVTLSVRQLEIRQMWDQFQEMLDTGETIQVRVSGVNRGGVTVDVQGIRGFIPRSHLLEKENLDSLIGRSITATFLEVNRENRRLVLSEKRASQAVNIRKLEVGQLVSGRIVGMKPFGLFVEFNGTTGLLHINQISQSYISSLEESFRVGQPIKAFVLDVDEIKRRVSLSTKVLENYPGEMLEKMETVMEEAEVRAEKAWDKLQKSEEKDD